MTFTTTVADFLKFFKKPDSPPPPPNVHFNVGISEAHGGEDPSPNDDLN